MCVWLHIISTPYDSNPSLSRQTASVSQLIVPWQGPALVVAPLCAGSTKMASSLSKKTTAIGFVCVCVCVCVCGGGFKQENWETYIVSILPDVDSYISWWISMGCVPFTQAKQITDHISSFKQIFSIVLAFNWYWEKPFICTSEQAFHLGSR